MWKGLVGGDRTGADPGHYPHPLLSQSSTSFALRELIRHLQPAGGRQAKGDTEANNRHHCSEEDRNITSQNIARDNHGRLSAWGGQKSLL